MANGKKATRFDEKIPLRKSVGYLASVNCIIAHHREIERCKRSQCEKVLGGLVAKRRNANSSELHVALSTPLTSY